MMEARGEYRHADIGFGKGKEMGQRQRQCVKVVCVCVWGYVLTMSEIHEISFTLEIYWAATSMKNTNLDPVHMSET